LSSTPFLPPRGGATRSINDPTATNTQRNLYMEDGLGGDESGVNGGSSGGGGGEYNLGVTPSTTPKNGKSQSSFVKKNGTKAPPSKIRLANGSVATTTATRMPTATRNGVSKKAVAPLGQPPMATVVAATATARPPIGMAKASNGVVVNKFGLPNVGAGVVDDYVDHPIPAEFVAETNLPTDVGQFRLRAYRTDPDPVNEFTGREPSVIYATDKSPFGSDGNLKENVPIRIHDQCLTSEVFRSQRYVERA
jgi:GTP cyclohydrolase II